MTSDSDGCSLLTDFSPADDKGGVIEELLLVLGSDHLTPPPTPITKTANQHLTGRGGYGAAGGTAGVPGTVEGMA